MPTYFYQDGQAGSGNPKKRFQYWLDNPPSAIAIDVETPSLEDRDPLGFAIAFNPHEAVYFDLRPEPPRELELIKPMLQNMNITKVGHNLMFDLGVWPLIPIVGDSMNRAKLFDTNVAARILGKIETALYLLAFEVGMEATPVSDMLGPKQTMEDLDPRDVARKCQNDAKVSYALYLQQFPKIDSNFREYFNIEMQALPIVLDMSLHGILIDQAKRYELSVEYEKEIKFLEEFIHGFGVEKPGSPMQVGYTLANRGNFLKFTKSHKQYRTDKSELEFLSDPLAAAILKYRRAAKFKSTYLDPLAGEDRFFTEYYFDTSVGRMNSRRRNIQNIPLLARAMLVPESGVFTTGDYSREHLYILAHMSQDRDMLRILYDPDRRRSDLHQHTADKMGVPRQLAKTLNFAVAYGATPRTVRDEAKIRDLQVCKRLIEDWFKTYKGVADWVQHAQQVGLRDGWSLPTLFGRRIRIPEDEKTDQRERKSVNYPVLGSDGEVIKRAIVLCNKRSLGPPKMVITVHDSITWDGSYSKQIPVEELQMIPGFKVPFDVKETVRWE